STSTPMPNEAKASWVFGIVFGIFLVGVFVFAPQSLPEFKQQILAFICASLAGFFAVFFTGALLLNAELPLPGKWIIKGGAGFALFLIVLFWWRSSSAPISVEPTKPSTSTTSGSPTGTTHDPVVVPPLDIPPIVNGGAPIGIKFQNRYTKNNIQCLGETVKVSATEWEERNASGSPESCYVDAVIFKYTERESKDTKYFLLYEEGRNLFARIPNIPVGETGPTDWRQPPSQAWNAGRVLTRVN
ncbi:MAG TPA: hypothetical protein VNK47_01680, partial [Candidatus Dormibacteraeota bacterium]|nr:hypothetical protein [Candidatus Dormibacteraeota bacterium]